MLHVRCRQCQRRGNGGGLPSNRAKASCVGRWERESARTYVCLVCHNMFELQLLIWFKYMWIYFIINMKWNKKLKYFKEIQISSWICLLSVLSQYFQESVRECLARSNMLCFRFALRESARIRVRFEHAVRGSSAPCSKLEFGFILHSSLGQYELLAMCSSTFHWYPFIRTARSWEIWLMPRHWTRQLPALTSLWRGLCVMSALSWLIIESWWSDSSDISNIIDSHFPKSPRRFLCDEIYAQV